MRIALNLSTSRRTTQASGGHDTPGAETLLILENHDTMVGAHETKHAAFPLFSLLSAYGL
jgi:hypothetical protein